MILTNLLSVANVTSAVDVNTDFTILWILLSGILVFYAMDLLYWKLV